LSQADGNALVGCWFRPPSTFRSTKILIDKDRVKAHGRHRFGEFGSFSAIAAAVSSNDVHSGGV
jgi:hypothetical protein